MELIINVTQDHIDRGKISASHCPIALAIRDIVGIIPVVCVDDGTITNKGLQPVDAPGIHPEGRERFPTSVVP